MAKEFPQLGYKQRTLSYLEARGGGNMGFLPELQQHQQSLHFRSEDTGRTPQNVVGPIFRPRFENPNRENLPLHPPNVRRSPLPKWYPRIPLQDVTCFINGRPPSGRRQYAVKFQIARRGQENDPLFYAPHPVRAKGSESERAGAMNPQQRTRLAACPAASVSGNSCVQRGGRPLPKNSTKQLMSMR